MSRKKNWEEKQAMRVALKERFPGADISIRADGDDMYRVRIVHRSFRGLREGFRDTLLDVVLSSLTTRILNLKPMTPEEFSGKAVA